MKPIEAEKIEKTFRWILDTMMGTRCKCRDCARALSLVESKIGQSAFTIRPYEKNFVDGKKNA